MASVLGKRKATTGGASPAKKPTSVTTKKAKKSHSTKSTKTAAAAAAATKKAVRPKQKEEQEPREIEEEGGDTAVAEAQEVFRRHFEAVFKPLPDAKPTKPKSGKTKIEQAEEEEENDEGEDDEDLEEDVGADGEEVADADEDDDEWSGLSGDDGSEDDEEEAEENVVQVVDHSSSTPAPVASMSKRELKAFMSSKPPTQTDPKPVPPTTTADDDAADENDKSNLANDLALQRLLSESHLLSRHAVTPFSNPTAVSKTFASGKLRARQTDLRAQALAPGVKSLFAQDKMPMAMRKGMNAHAAGREAKRRRQAKENGIVLEREGAKGKQNNNSKKRRSGGRADRSVDGPGVGRMRGAQLMLSERDVRSIEGPVRGGRRRGGGSRGGGRGGRGGGRG